jgi:hypothetical protein
MPNEYGSYNPDAAPQDQPLPQSPVILPTPHQNELRNSPEGATKDKEDETVVKLEKDIKTGERWLIKIGAAGVIMNVVIALIYYGQLREMRKSTNAATSAAETADKTLKEIRSGSSDTHELAVQAKNQADRAKEIAAQTLAQATAANKLAENAGESLANSKASIRPWVDAQKIVSKADLNEGTVTVNVEVVNSGSSPALHAVTYMEARPMCGADAQDFPSHPPYASNRESHPSTAMLLPNTSAELDHVFDVSHIDMIELNARSCTLYTYGTVTYCDIYRHFHWQHYCAKWVGHSQFNACFGYEDGDQDYPEKPLRRCPKEPSPYVPNVP